VTWDHALKTDVFLDTFFFTLTSFSVALIVPYLCSITIRASFFSRSVTFISEISYSIYLTHYLVIPVLAHIFKPFEKVKGANVLLFASSWVLIILLSALQYKFFEKKMTALREKFGRKQDAITI
jgi:peptidoglycan/LPS O-acetylase OafA/YrhL